MTLSGVLKDILLVVASMLIFGDPVSGLQAFGYSIALGGLVYYKLGADKLKEQFGGMQRSWAEFGATRPAVRKLIVFVLVLVTIFVLLGGISTSGYVPAEYNPGTLAGAATDRFAKTWAQKAGGS